MAGGMFTLRQLMERRRECQESMVLEFIDLKNAYDIQTSGTDYAFGPLSLEWSTRASLISRHCRKARCVGYPGRGNYIHFISF